MRVISEFIHLFVRKNGMMIASLYVYIFEGRGELIATKKKHIKVLFHTYAGIVSFSLSSSRSFHMYYTCNVEKNLLDYLDIRYV